MNDITKALSNKAELYEAALRYGFYLPKFKCSIITEDNIPDIPQKPPKSTNDLNIQFIGAANPGSLADCLATLARDPEVAMPSAAACTDEMFICCR